MVDCCENSGVIFVEMHKAVPSIFFPKWGGVATKKWGPHAVVDRLPLFLFFAPKGSPGPMQTSSTAHKTDDTMVHWYLLARRMGRRLFWSFVQRAIITSSRSVFRCARWLMCGVKAGTNANSCLSGQAPIRQRRSDSRPRKSLWTLRMMSGSHGLASKGKMATTRNQIQNQVQVQDRIPVVVRSRNIHRGKTTGPQRPQRPHHGHRGR